MKPIDVVSWILLILLTIAFTVLGIREERREKAKEKSNNEPLPLLGTIYPVEKKSKKGSKRND